MIAEMQLRIPIVLLVMLMTAHEVFLDFPSFGMFQVKVLEKLILCDYLILSLCFEKDSCELVSSVNSKDDSVLVHPRLYSTEFVLLVQSV